MNDEQMTALVRRIAIRFCEFTGHGCACAARPRARLCETTEKQAKAVIRAVELAHAEAVTNG